MNNQKEIWKDIPGFEGYYKASDLGNIKSLFFNKKLKLTKALNGYLCVNLSLKGKKKVYHVHQLVAMAFLNHKPCGHKLVVDHINHNKTDNRIQNLQILTHRQNVSKRLKKYTSKYVGVSYDSTNKKWMSIIRINKKRKNLGRFKNEIDAHLAYQKELKKINNA